MSELTAVVGPKPGPGHGESFIWAPGDPADVVAVDAGGTRAVGAHAGSFFPGVLILSHDDKDHIGGAVDLIHAARPRLRELWVPAEWAILTDQIARTTQAQLLHGADTVTSVAEVSAELEQQLVATADGAATVELTSEVIAAAEENLASWTTDNLDPNQGFLFAQSARRVVGWYGARNVDEIRDRVNRRAGAIVKIFKAADAEGIHVRFFSIDLALFSGRAPWLTAGKPGLVTMLNADDAPRAPAVKIPPGLPYSYALTRITIQNRRALSTLLWNPRTALDNSIVIWSDTDGGWLDMLRPHGLSKVTSALAGSSAPHHGSGNSAHDDVWNELRKAPNDLVVISAGGQKNQTFHTDYTALSARRCCTWCRPSSATYQEVRASSLQSGRMSLGNHACLRPH